MITSNRASLVLFSGKRSAAHVSEMLGVAPDASHEIGDPIRRRPGAVRDHSYWSSRFKVEADDDDGSGMSSVQLLVDFFEPHSTAFEALSADYRMEIFWSGDSDSPQAGFVIPHDLMGRLVRLGLTFVGTAFLGDD